MPKSQSYVLGFMFDPAMRNVVLIRKNRPTWQAGLLNGVGGKIEPEEAPLQAMVREFEEETGFRTSKEDWAPTGLVTGESFTVHCFKTTSPDYDKVRSMTDEQVRVFSLEQPIVDLYRTAQTNLLTLLGHALDPQGPELVLRYG